MKSRVLLAAPMALAVGCGYFSKKEVVSYSYGTEKVKNEQFIVAFSEGGQLEAQQAERRLRLGRLNVDVDAGARPNQELQQQLLRGS